MKQPTFIQIHQHDSQVVRTELIAGLSRSASLGGAFTSPKFLYDALGSRLFDAITELPEYYPTRTEAAIFKTHTAAMASHLPRGAVLVDLGAGNCKKAASLFDALAPSRYVAVDISVEFLRQALAGLQWQYPALEMLGVGLDFSQALNLPAQALRAAHPGGAPQPRILFYPGSSIGNFSPAQALMFLRQVRAACVAEAASGSSAVPGSGLLIGVDLVKDAAELQAAYDDALGVTAAFNLNMLLNINALLGSDFAVSDWQHVGLYHAAQSRIEMHLQARRAVSVRWPGGGREFAQGERIHTENSCKWTIPRFTQLLVEAGFAQPVVWTDAVLSEQGRFAVMWAAA